MAHEIKLNYFSVAIKEQKKDNYQSFPEYFSENTNSTPDTYIVDFLKQYIKFFDGHYMVQKATGKAIFMTSDLVFNSEKKTISGIIKGGVTGIGSNIDQKDNPDDTVFTKTKDHIESRPHYFLFWFPEDSNRGILILQNYSNVSISNPFRKHFKNFTVQFEKTAYNMLLFPLVPKETIKTIKEKGIIKKISLKKKSLPGDVADKLLGTIYEDDGELNIELSITNLTKLNLMQDTIKGLVNGENTQFLEILNNEDLKSLGFDKNTEIDFTFEHNGKQAIAKSTKNYDISPAFYINDKDIVRDIDNIPTFESLDLYCKSFLEELMITIGYRRT